MIKTETQPNPVEIGRSAVADHFSDEGDHSAATYIRNGGADDGLFVWFAVIGARAMQEAMNALPTPPQTADTLTLGEAAQDLVAARDKNEMTVGYRTDLWDALRACLAALAQQEGEANE